MKTISLFALILIISFSIALGQDSKSPEAGNAYNKGLDFAKKGDFKSEEQKENLQAVNIQAGIRVGFWKSKKL